MRQSLESQFAGLVGSGGATQVSQMVSGGLGMLMGLAFLLVVSLAVTAAANGSAAPSAVPGS